jgi:DNA-directed RNA polymerase specialized sigma24 family protein
MNLSLTKDEELRERGRTWLDFVGVPSGYTEDIIQNAMLFLIKDYKRVPEADEEEFANVNWKKMMHSAYVNWVRSTKSYANMLDRYANSLGEYEDRTVFILEARDILNKTLPLLTVAEHLVVLALMENNFQIKWAAKELGCVRQNVYQHLSRIRERLSPMFDLTHNDTDEYNGPEVEYRWKTGQRSDESWSANHPTCVEIFDTTEITTHEFIDREEAEKIWPVTTIKGEDYEQK